MQTDPNLGVQAETEANTWEDAVQWLRSQSDKQELVRDAYYDDPLEAAAERYWKSEEWEAIRCFLPKPPGDALDLGAGRGIASYALARDGFAVTALEPDDSAIVGSAAIEALARGNALPVEVVQTISERLPFEDCRFDVVFARAVLHHIGDLPAAIRECRRVLKPGGTFIAVREHVISRDEDLQAFLDAHPLHHRYGGENAFRVSTYVDAIEQAGLAIQHVLKPLESPINYAPHTRSSLCREMAQRLSAIPLAAPLAHATLRAPVVGPLLMKLAGKIDNRPGRHYSFVALRSA